MKPQNKTHALHATWLVVVTAALFLAGTSWLPAQEEDYEILVRGPVHEAFAEAVSLDPEPGLIITTAPPEPIEELPPEHQLEGDNVAWIPGYWTWDDERDDFIWLSGVWRNIPPGRQWVPGYWEDLPEARYQWVAGFWEDADVVEVAYIATAPPRSLEIGPNSPAPATNYNWAPGNWVYADTSYNWRPGQWIDYRDNWTWIPGRYHWTPRGYVYVNGYWDYHIDRRGVLFAPVYYRNHDYYRSPGYRYTPSIAVALDVFLDHLFVRPRYHHYYFGDYYEPRYRDSGYYGSYSWHSQRGGYDPIFAYQRWDHRDDRDWDKKRRNRHDYYRDHKEARPLQTWSEVRAYAGQSKDDDRQRSFARTLDSLAKNPGRDQKFRTTSEDDRDRYIQGAKELRKYQGERRLTESKSAESVRDRKDAKDRGDKPANREQFGRSPVTGRDVEKLSKEEAPPMRPDREGRPVAGRDRVKDKDGKRPDSPERGKSDKSDKETPSKKGQPDRGRAPVEKDPKRMERNPDNGKPEASKREKVKPEAPKPEKARPEVPKREKVKPEAPKPEKARPEAPKREKAKPEAPKPEKARPEAPKREKVKPERRAPEPKKPERTRQPGKSQPQSDDSERSKGSSRERSDDKERGKKK